MMVTRTELIYGLETTYSYDACEKPCTKARDSAWVCSCGARFEDNHGVSRAAAVHGRQCSGVIAIVFETKGCAACR